MGDIQTFSAQMPEGIVQYWGWFLAFGIAVTALGVVAVARSFTATIVSMLFFGWMLVIASGLEIAQAVMVGHWAGFFRHLLAAILFGVIGLLLVARPLISAGSGNSCHRHLLPDRRAVSADRRICRGVFGLGLGSAGRSDQR